MHDGRVAAHLMMCHTILHKMKHTELSLLFFFIRWVNSTRVSPQSESHITRAGTSTIPARLYAAACTLHYSPRFSDYFLVSCLPTCYSSVNVTIVNGVLASVRNEPQYRGEFAISNPKSDLMEPHLQPCHMVQLMDPQVSPLLTILVQCNILSRTLTIAMHEWEGVSKIARQLNMDLAERGC
jgi:hypothetical protein